ncbi:MAG: crystallin J1 [Bacteroidetes bacterium]|nr:MAG: crystallin J1 [Bacteroidota bacterium]
MNTKNPVKDGLLGHIVADALGVPVEFQTREELDANPVTNMREYGTYNQPKGSWSDDSSLALCLADCLTKGFDLKDMARQFINWKTKAHWTPHGEVFDIGITTSESINLLVSALKQPNLAKPDMLKYIHDEYANGNGSLMRILPLHFYLQGSPPEESFDLIWDVSALTHGHIRSAIACMIYLIFADEIAQGNNLSESNHNTRERTKTFFKRKQISDREKGYFHRILNREMPLIPREEIKSDGYVIHSLEAAIWCLLTSNDYPSTVLKAVNLGKDTDTTAAIVGGLAGLFYGEEAIPADWKNALVKRTEIEDLCERLWGVYRS